MTPQIIIGVVHVLHAKHRRRQALQQGTARSKELKPAVQGSRARPTAQSVDCSRGGRVQCSSTVSSRAISGPRPRLSRYYSREFVVITFFLNSSTSSPFFHLRLDPRTTFPRHHHVTDSRTTPPGPQSTYGRLDRLVHQSVRCQSSSIEVRIKSQGAVVIPGYGCR